MSDAIKRVVDVKVNNTLLFSVTIILCRLFVFVLGERKNYRS